MWLRSKPVFKCGDVFYSDGQVFKGHLRKTIVDGRREHAELYGRKEHAPKSPQRTFREDYLAFKERRGFQDIYVRIDGCYNNDANVGQFQVILPVYSIEDGIIKTIYEEKRGWYPLTILECEPIDKLPWDEGGTIEPNEIYKDCIGRFGRDSNMFVALNGHNAEHKFGRDNMQYRDMYASITGCGFPIANIHNKGMKYNNGELTVVE